MNRIFLLYTDKKQTQLLALAHNVKQRKEITRQYTSGQWFSYETDPDPSSNAFYGDTEELVAARFPKEIKEEDLLKRTTLAGNVTKDEF